MLHFLPAPYPDELIYSVFCRYHIRSSNLSTLHSTEDLFGYRKERVSVELGSELAKIITRLQSPYLSPEEILIQHTLLPYYARFWNTQRKENVMDALINGNGKSVSLVGMNTISGERNQYFRYCPICYKHDVSTYGEPYWHRAHQLQDIRICTRHGCWLSDTNVPLLDNLWTLRPALLGIELSTPQHGELSQQEIDVSSLYIKTLTSPFDAAKDGNTYARVFDVQLIRQQWRTPVGKSTRTKAMSAAMRDFYGAFVPDDDISPLRLTVTFDAAKSAAPRFILLVAHFLGLQYEELFAKIRKKNCIAEIKKRLAAGESRRSIARHMGIDPATVKRWSQR